MRRRPNHQALADPELVRRANDGDKEALEVLLGRHYDSIIVLCRRLCSDRGAAEDAAQNALISIARAIGSFDGRSQFSTWTYRIATNACLDEIRRRGRLPVPSSEQLEQDRLPSRSLDGHQSGADEPETFVERNEQSRQLADALDELGDPFRTPVVLRDLAGLDYGEIAELLELAPGTIRSRIRRGRMKLGLILGLEEALSPGDDDTPGPAEVSIGRNQIVPPNVITRDDK